MRDIPLLGLSDVPRETTFQQSSRPWMRKLVSPKTSTALHKTLSHQNSRSQFFSLSFRWSGFRWIQRPLQLRWASSTPCRQPSSDLVPFKTTQNFVRWAQTFPTVWKHRSIYLGTGTLPLEDYSSFLTKVYRSLWRKIRWAPFSTMTSLLSCRKPYCQYPVRIIFINVLFLLSTYTEKQNFWNSYLWARRCWSSQTQEPSRWWFLFFSVI